MSWDTVLAKEFKKRDNPKSIGACIGTVTSVEPFAGFILDGQILLDSSNTYLCNQLLERESEYKLDNIEQDVKIQLKEVMKVGDMVLVLPAADEQKFFVIDIIKGVG